MPPQQPLGRREEERPPSGLSRQRSTYCRSFGHFFLSFILERGRVMLSRRADENHRSYANSCVKADEEALVL